MNPIRNPFSRDAHPDLTAEILKIVNEDIQTPARQREMKQKIKRAEHAADAAANRYMRAGDEAHKSADSDPKADKAYRKAGADYDKAAGKEDKLLATSRKEKTSKRLFGKGGKLLKRKGVSEDLQTPERAAEMAARKKKASQHSADAMKRYPNSAGTAAIIGNEIGISIKDKRERESKKTYGKGGKVVSEDAQLDERIIDEVDFFQASKNLLKGKGFKTNREATYDRVKKNYEAMKARQAAEAKGKGKGKTK